MVPRKVASGDGSGIGVHGRPDQECVTGIICGHRSYVADLLRRRLRQRIENLDAVVGLVDCKEDKRCPIFHDQDSGENQCRNVENIPLHRLGLKAGAPGCAIVQRNGQPSVEYRKTSEEGLSTDGTTVVRRQIGQ